MRWAEINMSEVNELIALNDERGFSFWQIAEHVKEKM